MSVLFSACLFPLHCRTYAWSGKSYGAHVCYAGLLVRDPCDLYNHRCEAASGDPDCILGLSTDLVIKLHSVFDFLSEIRLDPWF